MKEITLRIMNDKQFENLTARDGCLMDGGSICRLQEVAGEPGIYYLQHADSRAFSHLKPAGPEGDALPVGHPDGN